MKSLGDIMYSCPNDDLDALHLSFMKNRYTVKIW